MRVREAYLRYRATEVVIPDRHLATPEEVYEAYRHLNHLAVETFMGIFMNAKNRVMSQACLGQGTVDHCTVYPRELFVRALYAHASGIVCVHNHPSGDPTPSPQDKTITEALSHGAMILGFRFLDHIIIGEGQWFSFRRSGLL